MGSAFSFSSQLQSPVLHLSSMSIFSFFLFSASMLVAKQEGNHASTYFIFGIFAYMLFFVFIIYAMMMLEDLSIHMFM